MTEDAEKAGRLRDAAFLEELRRRAAAYRSGATTARLRLKRC